MSKSLKSLIRLNEWTVDEKRRELAAVLDALAHAEQEARSLEDELKREQAQAEQSPQESGLFYGNYASGVITRRETLQRQVRDITKKAEEARDILNDAFRELKKYQTAEKNRLLKETEEFARKETVLLDEIGLQNYTRKQLDVVNTQLRRRKLNQFTRELL